MMSTNFSGNSKRPISLPRSVPKVALAGGNAPFNRFLRPQIGRRRQFLVRSAVPASPHPAAPLANGQEDHMVDAVPAHWRDHMAKLRVGERKILDRYLPIIIVINKLEPEMQALSDSELAAKTEVLRGRAAGGEPLFQLLPEAFAVVREASSRVLGMRHYDVQLLGGIVLAEGKVAEMGTGEGKTLVAALPAYLKALTGRGVHVVTVNEYLAQRDASWVGKVLSFLGLSVGTVVNSTSPDQKTVEFAKDITYVTSYELAFTFLNDHLAPTAQAISMRRPFHYAIVDEVDSVLIDDARTPFIINGPNDSVQAEDLWATAVEVAASLKEMSDEDFRKKFTGPLTTEELAGLPCDFIADRRSKKAVLTQQGMLTSVEELIKHEKVILARKKSPSSSAATTPLVVVLLFKADGGAYEMWQRSTVPTLEGPSGVLTGVNATDASSRDVPPKLVESLEEVNAALCEGNDWDLERVPVEEATVKELQAAASAVLWSGGERAWGRFLMQAVNATHLFDRDIDYIVKEGEVVIVDTASGRERIGSRWQDGLHQALEAKEAKRIKEETALEFREAEKMPKVLPEYYDRGRITYQALFAGYPQLAGMTGTASTEMEELAEFYGLLVVRVPPHRPSRRIDHRLAIYMAKDGWKKQLKNLVRGAAKVKRPVLLGTCSVGESEEVLKLLSEMPLEAELTEDEVVNLIKALRKLPANLLPPEMFYLTRADLLEMSEEMENDVLDRWHYENFYRQAVYVLKSVAYKAGIGADNSDVVTFAVETLTTITTPPTPGLLPDQTSRILLSEAEMTAFTAVLEAVRPPYNRSLLKECVPINLLNARPEEVRRESETIAQAGLPGTITVATAMAGRGTDILLGGNPKGLTQMLLQRFILPVLAPAADDLKDWTPSRQKLGGFNNEFASEQDISKVMPLPVLCLFRNALAAVKEGAGVAENELDGQQLGSAGQMTPSFSSNNSEKMQRHGTASQAAVTLREVLEDVEMDRSMFLKAVRRRRQQQQPQDLSLDSTLEGALKWLDADGPEGPLWGDGMKPAERAVRRYGLLQWLWFDARCAEYAEQVKKAGGLMAVITSLQPSRRTDLQIRGRAGRQGDAGDTYLLSSRDDSLISSMFNPVDASALLIHANKTIEELRPDEEVPLFLTMPVVNKVINMAEQAGLDARSSTRKYDIIIDPLRRHIFRLRRVIAAGGDAARAALAHRYLRQLAADMVTQHADPAASPATWTLEELFQDVELLFKDPLQPEESNSGGVPSNSAAVPVPGCIMSISKGSNGTSKYVLKVQLVPAATAKELQTALLRNVALPAVKVFSGKHAVPLRRRVVLQMVRQGLESQQQQLALPQRKGLYACQAARLDLWLGDLLVALYERKRSSTASMFLESTMKSASPAGAFPHAASALRLWERDTALDCLDELWSDFLQDVATLQNAVVSRFFTQLDPVDEFKLEAAQAFTRLLADLYRQTAVALLGPVDEWQLQTYSIEAERMLSNANADAVGGLAPLGRMLTEEIEWAEEWAKRGGPAAAASGSAEEEVKGDVETDVWDVLGHKEELSGMMREIGGNYPRAFEVLSKALEEGFKNKSSEEIQAAVAGFAASKRAEERAEGKAGKQQQQR